jgi:hypothetical protein
MLLRHHSSDDDNAVPDCFEMRNLREIASSSWLKPAAISAGMKLRHERTFK